MSTYIRAAEVEHLVRQILHRHNTAPSDELIKWANTVILIGGELLSHDRRTRLEAEINDARTDPVRKERARVQAARTAEDLRSAELQGGDASGTASALAETPDRGDRR